MIDIKTTRNGSMLHFKSAQIENLASRSTTANTDGCASASINDGGATVSAGVEDTSREKRVSRCALRSKWRILEEIRTDAEIKSVDAER